MAVKKAPKEIVKKKSAKKDASKRKTIKAAKSTKTAKSAKSAKTTKSKAKGKKFNDPSVDAGIVIVDDDIVIDQERINEERRAYLEEARSQEASD